MSLRANIRKSTFKFTYGSRPNVSAVYSEAIAGSKMRMVASDAGVGARKERAVCQTRMPQT